MALPDANPWFRSLTTLMRAGQEAWLEYGRLYRPVRDRPRPSPEPAWSASLAEACDLGPSGPDYSVSHNPHLGCYAMFWVDPYDKKLMFRGAPDVWGPYSPPQAIIGLPHARDSEMVYLAFEHPDFRDDGGRTVYISYCQPRFTSNSLVKLRFR